MMEGLKQALEYIVDGIKGTEVIEVDGEKYFTGPATKIVGPRVKDYFECTTLDGVIDYIKADIDNHDDYFGQLTIHIESPTRVSIFGQMNKDLHRDKLLEATAITPSFRTNVYYDSETFNIELMSKFMKEENLETILHLSSHLVEDSEVTVADDGFSQRTAVKTGIASVEKIEIANPFDLIPYRSFSEVGQPKSLFIED